MGEKDFAMIQMGRMTEEELDREAWELTRQLVRINSSDPGPYEGEIGTFICRWFADRGIETQREEVLPGRFNVMAAVGAPEGRALVYICHMDTVILGDGWTEGREPLAGMIEVMEGNGITSQQQGRQPQRDAAKMTERLYGRGACDMKSGLACAMVAFAWAADRLYGGGTDRLAGSASDCDKEKPGYGLGYKNTEDSDSGISRIVFIGTVDEEDFMRGSEAAIRSGWVKADDWIVDMEPTDGQIQAAHKGRVWFELTIEGAAAHASMPWKGADAIAAMAEAISSIRRGIGRCPSHPELGISTVTFGQIQGGVRPYVVPERCRVWIDMRLVPPMDQAGAEEVVKAAIQAAREAVPGTDGSYVITGSRPFVERDPQSGLYQALQQSCRRVTGQEAMTGPFPGYTDTAVIAGILHNHNCMSYGPGSLAMAHKPDEYVDRDDVVRCRRVFCDLAARVL
ncbi:MAG: M20 family metallopeptidase [Lachnospiraceae bacterium]|nr:M20 family metallopeptidase [Lachnospiraceae bacterium]